MIRREEAQLHDGLGALHMFSLIVFAIIGAYFLLVCFAALLGRIIALSAGGGRVAARWAAFVGACMVLLPVFWDILPALVAHRYYCAKDAGVQLYKEPQQWYAETKGAKIAKPKVVDRSANGIRQNWGNFEEKIFVQNIFLSVRLNRSRLVDSNTGEVLLEKKWYSIRYDFNNYKHLLIQVNYCPMPDGDLRPYDVEIEKFKRM